MKQFATPDDFKRMTGKDLYYLLTGKNDNESNYPFIFLEMVQEFLIEWCDESGFRRMRLSDLSPMQQEYLKRAIIWQAYYTWKNGSLGIGLESGVDLERGKILALEDIKAVEVPSRVVTLLHKSGLFNLKIKNRPRFNRGYPGIAGSYTGEDY